MDDHVKRGHNKSNEIPVNHAQSLRIQTFQTFFKAVFINEQPELTDPEAIGREKFHEIWKLTWTGSTFSPVLITFEYIITSSINPKNSSTVSQSNIVMLELNYRKSSQGFY